MKKCSLTLSQTTNFRLFQIETLCRQQFGINENGRWFSKRLENTVGKGEIACYEQFSFSHSVFKRLILQTREDQELFGKGLISIENRRSV